MLKSVARAGLNATVQLMYGSPIIASPLPHISAGILNPFKNSGPDVHINIQQAYQEANTLEEIADEIRAYGKEFEAAIEEMSGIWRGMSAQRAEQALEEKADLTAKLGDNVELIALGVRGTAQTFQIATMVTGG